MARPHLELIRELAGTDMTHLAFLSTVDDSPNVTDNPMHALQMLGGISAAHPSLALLQECAEDPCYAPDWRADCGLAMLGDHPELASLTLLLGCATESAMEILGQRPAPALECESFPSLAMLGTAGDLPNLHELHLAAGSQHMQLVATRRQSCQSAPGGPHKYLATLGQPAGRSALHALQLSGGDATVAAAKECEAFAAEQEVRAVLQSTQMPTDPMQGSAARALRKREEEAATREQELKRREAALAEREKQLESRETALVVAASPQRQQPRVASPHKAAADNAGVLIDDDDLKELFATYDRSGDGYVSKTEFKQEYRSFEDFGLPLTDRQLDSIFAQFGGEDDRLSYEEFSILMLQRAKI